MKMSIFTILVKTLLLVILFLFANIAGAQNPFVPKYDAVKRSERCYTITWEANNQFGAVWWAEKVDFSRDTLFNFVIYMGDRDGNGADGIAFVMHQDPRDTITDPSQQVIIGGAGTWDLSGATGDDGGGLGFAMHQSRVGPNTIPGPHGPGDDPENHKIQKSVAVEFDTWNNNDIPDGNNGFDANGAYQMTSPYFGWDHTAVVYNGDLYGGQQVITDANGNSGRILPLKPDYAFGSGNNPDGSLHHNIEDDRCYLYQIRWQVNSNGTQDLQLWADVYNGSTNTDELQMIMSHTDDMITNVFGGNTEMRFGFTGSTGGSINEQTICLLGENQQPYAQDDFANIAINETSIIDIESNDNDPDGDQLHTPIILATPKHGQATIRHNTSNQKNEIEYTPNSNFVGKDTLSYVTCDVNSTKPYAKCDTAYVFIVVHEELKMANYNKSYFNVEIVGEDTACINSDSSYEVRINTNENKFFDPKSSISGRVTQYNPLIFNYDGLDVQNTFTFDFWVKPSVTINMKGESSVCYGGVSVPLANSGQNWAVFPGHVNPNFGVGVTVGTNGIMIAEHSANILVSRLSHSATINDWTHVGVVYNPGGLSLYLDGNLIGTRPMHCNTSPKFAPNSIASALYSNHFQGAIDEFRLWDNALTSQEIVSLKDKKLVNEIESLRYYVSFDNEQFIKALGDLGTDSLSIVDVSPEVNIVQSSWDLDPYTGENISALFPFTTESLDYLWSTNGTDKTISFIPKTGSNEIIAQAYNEYLSISDTITIVGKDCGNVANDTRYIRFRSYYSEDNSQVNVYEIQAFKDGVNVGLNMPTFANSHEFGNNEQNVNDGDGNSRWSSDRHDPGADADNPHFIVVDLQQGYDLDSIILNIEGFDHWDQTFDFAISSDSVNWDIIGSETSTTGIFTYLNENEGISDLEFQLQEQQVATNQDILIPVTVKGFNDILTAQYTISWDPAIAEYLGVKDFNLRDLSESSFHLFEPGKLTFSWNPADLQTESVPDDTEIFNMVFKAVGTVGQETAINFSDVPTPREISDGDGEVLNANYVNGKITIIDEIVLGGYIKTQKGEPLIGMEVKLVGEMDLNTTTDEFGWYSFTVLPNQEYHIAPSFDTEADDGVTTLDVVIMHWHVLGKKYMMSKHDLIACDVNESKSLTTLDLAETRAVILHNKDKFRDRNSVEFVNQEYTGDPDIFEYKNYLDITPTQSHLNLNYTAVKLGDAGRNWKANKNTNGREQNLREIEIEIEKKYISDHQVITQLLAQDFTEIVGLQFTIKWNPEVYKYVKSSKLNIDFICNENLFEEGIMTFTWNSEELEGLSLSEKSILSELEFMVLDDQGDPELEISSELTPALAFNSNLETMHVKGKVLNSEFLRTEDLSVYPNPANDHINIFSHGKLLKHYSILTSTGAFISSGDFLTNASIDVNHLKKGLYIIQLSDENNQVINKKFIKQ